MVAFTEHQKRNNIGEDSSQKQFTSIPFLFVRELENTTTKFALINFANRCILRSLNLTERHLLSLGVLGKTWYYQIVVINLFYCFYLVMVIPFLLDPIVL